MAEITDPDVLKQFDAQPTAAAPSGLVTDPEILKHFNLAEPEKKSAVSTANLPDVGAPLIHSGPSWQGNETANDIADSAATGLFKGPFLAAGTIGDASNLLAKGSKTASDYLSEKMGTGKSPELSPSIFPSSSDLLSAVERSRGKFDQPQTTAGKYAEAAGEYASNPLSYLGPGAPLAKGLTAIGSGLGSEAGSQFADYEGMTPLGKAVMPLVGAIAGGHLAAAPPAAITPNIISTERQAMLDTLRNEGVTSLTAGQQIGSKPLKYTESVMADQPFAGRNSEQINEDASHQFTRAALRRVGENADRATPEVVDNAFNRIGGQFSAIGARNNVVADAPLWHDLASVQGEYNGLVGPSQRAPVVANTIQDINDIVARNGGHIAGDQYNALTSRLARQARGASNDPQLQEALHGMREAVDDAFSRTLQSSTQRTVTITNPVTGTVNHTVIQTGPPNPDLAALQQARREYRNLMVIERAATSGGAEKVGQGIITPAALSTAVKGAFGRRSFARGQDDFTDLARAGTGVMTPLPQSGTGPRENIVHHLQLGGLLAAEPAAAAAGANTPEMIAAALGGIAAPALAGRAIMSGPVQRYIANQAIPYRFGTSPNTIALMNAIRGNQAPPTVTRDGQQRLYVSPPAK